MISASACQHWQPDRQLIPAQSSRSYTTLWDTIGLRGHGFNTVAAYRLGAAWFAAGNEPYGLTCEERDVGPERELTDWPGD